MTNILRASFVSESLVVQLREWFESEWGHIDSFDGNHPEVAVPRPIVAVDEDESLIGGLVFSSFEHPLSTGIAVWINAVIVSPEQQKKGIASELVRAAEGEAKLMTIGELFVLSEFPGLYEKHGWKVVGLDSSRKEPILTKKLEVT